MIGFQWLSKLEESMSKEPFKVTVKDELELNIQKYQKLSAVIEQKKKNIEEVIDYGTQERSE